MVRNAVTKWLEDVVSMDGTLKGKARSNRMLLFYSSASVLLLEGALLFFTEPWPLSTVVFGLGILCHVLMLVTCMCRVQLTLNMIRAYVVVLGVGIMGSDLHLRTLNSPPQWPTFVLLADLSLVIGLGRRFATGVTAAAAVWIVISTAETMLRFGLFDFPGLPSEEARRERLEDICVCQHPPCSASVPKGMFEMQTSVIVLMIDFAATRSFADSVEREKAAMACTIETVEAIAQLLAGYDVDTVAEMLQEAEGRLPAAMHETLQKLEQNLRVYRPYLPKSCLPARGDSDEWSSLSSSALPCPDYLERCLTKTIGVLKTVRATVFVVNTRNTLESLEQGPHIFTAFFDTLLTAALMAVESRRGLIEMFIGDRVLASFNASRPCLVHASAAAGAAQQVMQAMRGDNTTDGALRVDIGAASGHVLCGDTGCAEMRHFSLLGGLPVVVCGMERAARALGLDVVCNTSLQRDADHAHLFLLVPRLVRILKLTRVSECMQAAVQEPGRSDNAAIHIYELVHDTPGPDAGPLAGEWMYHIGKAAAEWAPYNAAMRGYLAGCDTKKVAAEAGDHHSQAQEAIRLLGSTEPLVLNV